MANIVAKENMYKNCKVNKNIILNEAISESKDSIVINCNCNNNNQFSFCACNEKVPCNLKERVSRFLERKQLYIRIGLVAILLISWLLFYFTYYHFILQNDTRAKFMIRNHDHHDDHETMIKNHDRKKYAFECSSYHLPVCPRKYPDFLTIHEKVEVNVSRSIYTDFSIIHEKSAWKYPSFLNMKIIKMFDIVYTLCINIPNKLYSFFLILKVIIVFKIISRLCKKIFNYKLYSFFSFFTTYSQIIVLLFIHSIFIAYKSIMFALSE